MLAPAGLALALALALAPAIAGAADGPSLPPPAAVGGPGDECSVDADCAPSLYYCCSSYCNGAFPVDLRGNSPGGNSTWFPSLPREKPYCDSWCMDCIEPEPELTVHEMIDLFVS